MKDNSPLIACLVICMNEKHHLKESLDSLKTQTYKNLKIYLLDNFSTDGSKEFVKENYPNINILSTEKNVGFAEINNIGMEMAFSEGADFCIVMNCDTRSDKNMVEELYKSFFSINNKVKNMGLVQSTILLHDNPGKINTIGNAIHYLGFGYCKDLLKEYNRDIKDKEILFASGCCFLISKKYYQEIGGFDEEFIAYNEDQNLSWRGLMQDYRHFVSAKSIIYHKYNFHKRPIKMYYSEKNRQTMLIQNYNLKTLILIAPLWFLVEILLIIYSLLNGWFKFKIKSYVYIITNFRKIMRNRKTTLNQKRISDKDLIKKFDRKFEFLAIDNIGIKLILNPILTLYYKFILILI